MADRTSIKAWLIRFAFGLVAIWLPARYLLSTGTTFHVDWTNHEWMVGYFGQHFRVHHWMPSALQTPELAGVPVPVFYGHLFYPLLAIPSAVLAPGIVVRLAAIGILALQYALVSRAFTAIGGSWFVSRAVACIVIWAIYPLTNLYNRAALTEFVATGLLVCAGAMIVLLVTTTDAHTRRFRASALVFFVMFAAGTHPITALYGIPLFLCLVPAVWLLLRDNPAQRRSVFANVAVWIPLAVLCLIPWYLVSASMSRHLIVGHDASVVFFPSSIDDWTTRLYPIPHDSRVIAGQPLANVSTPYLDAQISWPLIVLFIGAVAASIKLRARRSLAIAGVASVFLVFFLLLSLVPGTYSLLPARAGSIQYAYRAVTYVNLTALLGAMLAVMATPSLLERVRPPVTAAVAGACLLLAGAGVVVKWGHVAAVETHEGSTHVLLSAEERSGLVHMPRWFYGAPDYATPAFYEEAPTPPAITRDFAVNDKARFGKLNAATVELDTESWVTTNILAFAWNEILVDDVPVPRSQLRRVKERIAVLVPAGKHKLAAKLQAPSWWTVTRAIAIVASWLWLLALVIAYALLARRTRATDPAP